MTRPEFIERYVEVFMGNLMTMALNQHKDGAEMFRLMKLLGMRVREQLSSVFTDLCPQEVVKEFHGEEKPKPQLKVR